MSFQPNQSIYTCTAVNLRTAPGHLGNPPPVVLTLLPERTACVVTGAAITADELTWWPLRVMLEGGQVVEGWAAESVGEDRLLADVPIAPQPPVQPVTPPPRLPPQLARDNKLGFYLHLSTDQYGMWDAVSRVQPPVLLIHADTANDMLLQEIRRFRAPDAFVIGRLYKDVNTQRQLLESEDPEGQGRALAEEILNYNFGLATKRGENGRLLIDAWMSLNEAVPGPASQQFSEQPEATARLLHNYDRFQVAFRQKLQERGIEAVAFNFGAGNFGTPEHYLEHFPSTLANYIYLGFHEYGWPTLYPAQGSATSGGTYRPCMAGIRARYGDRHRVIITEAGLTRMYQNPAWGDVGWLNPDATLPEDAYWQSLAWYNEQMTQDAYVLGACLFEVGHHGNWATFRHLGTDNHDRSIGLIDRIVALKDSAPRGGIQPIAPIQRAPVRIFGTVMARGKPLSGATVRLIGAQETLGGVRTAASVAASAITWTRRIKGFKGTTLSCWRKYGAAEVAGLSYAEFKTLVARYNPSLQETKGLFQARRTYDLPENSQAAPIVWDRPLTGFAGTLRACWQQHVENKVVGLAYTNFQQAVLTHNPLLQQNKRRFAAEQRYNLPRNVDQKAYALTTTTGTRGRFRFDNVPPGHYNVDVTADGYWPFSTGFACQAALELPVNLRPLIEIGTRGLDSGFVQVAGNEFVLHQQPFRFVGVNIRGLVYYGDGRTLPAAPDNHRAEQLRAARAIGARVVRVFLPSQHANSQETADRFRNLLALIKQDFPEIYLIPALTNLYADVPFRVQGDDRFYQDNVLIKDFFTGGYQANYLPFVRQIIETFRSEPQILAWEIGNELKLDRGNKADENDPNPLCYIDFVHAVAAFIRQLDPNHLITTGMISTRHAWLFSSALKRRLYESPNLDFVTIHAYQGSNEEDDRPVANELGIPFMIEEAGFDAEQGADRSSKVAEDMQKWFGLGARGYLQWGFMATPDNGDGDRQSGMDRAFHSDWDQLAGIYRARAQELAQVDPNWRPPVVTPPPTSGDSDFSQGQTVFAQDWLKVRKSPGYVDKPGDDVLGLLAVGAPATILGNAMPQDGLIWWPIRATISSGASVDGWAAAANETQVLLASAAPPVAMARAASRAMTTGLQQAFAQTYVNVRKDPGYVDKPGDHVIGQIAPGAPLIILGGPQTVDGLTWWQVRAPLLDESTSEGWVAEVDPNGERLIDSTPPPTIATVTAMPDYLGQGFTNGSAATVIAAAANIRAVAGLGQGADQILATVPRGTKVLVLGGPQSADGIDWMQVEDEVAPSQTGPGWIAIADPGGARLLAPATVAAEIRVQTPFANRWALSQGWGSWPEEYSKILYDGVPLKGHNGLDFATPVGTPLLATDSGFVKRVDVEPDGFGNFVIIEHAWGESLYAHLERVDVSQNAAVSAGQQLGLSGESGHCYGAHLHFGIRIFPYRRTDGWGGFCDPSPFMDPADLVATRAAQGRPQPMAPELPGRRRP